MELNLKMQETPRQSAIEQRRPIGDLNEVHSGDTEPDVVTDGGVSGGGSSPPDSGAADSKQIVPLVVVDQEGGDSQETTAPIIGGGISPEFRSKSAAPGITTVVDGRVGVGGGGLSFDLNAEIKSLSSDDDEIEVIDGGDDVGEPNRKRMRYGGGDGGVDGEPSQNLRLFGIDINSIEEEEVGGGGGLPELGFRREEEEGSEDDDDASGGGGAVVDGGEPPIIQQPIRGGCRLFGHDI